MQGPLLFVTPIRTWSCLTEIILFSRRRFTSIKMGRITRCPPPSIPLATNPREVGSGWKRLKSVLTIVWHAGESPEILAPLRAQPSRLVADVSPLQSLS